MNARHNKLVFRFLSMPLLLAILGLAACGSPAKNCPEACKVGEKKCAEDGVLQCAKLVDSGCFVWTKLPCQASETCTIVNNEPQCFTKSNPSCDNPTAEKRCVGQDIFWFDNCGNQKNIIQSCTAGQTCSRGACVNSNTNDCSCTPGTRRCDGVKVQLCTTSGTCNQWKTEYACPRGQTCNNGKCEIPNQCQNACTLNQRRCSGQGVETCVKDAKGCTSWKFLIGCQSGQTCSNGQCQSSCQNQCSVGQKRCSTTGIQTCVQQGSCAVWGSVQNCPANSRCVQSGSNFGCACNPGFTPSGGACVSSSGGSGSCNMTAEEKKVFDLTNQERAKVGAKALKCHVALTKAAQEWSLKQCQARRISHDNFSSRVRATGLRYYGAAENVAAGQTTPESVVRAWMNSSGHRKNILNSSLTHLGVGVSRCSGSKPYWTQIFVRMP